jgi:cyclic pyranopterin phosphate synthase
MPKVFRGFAEPAHWLSFDEIERVIKVFGGLGVRRVRLTGGEPLVRRNLPELVARLSRLPGIEDLSLSTNASQLARYAADLKRAGVGRINVSLDSLRPERFRTITQVGRLDKVLEGLEAAREVGFDPIKINMVAMRGVNDDEIEAMVQFCVEQDFTLRLIETMPMGSTGLHASQHYIDLQEIKKRLARSYRLVPTVMPGGGPARYVKVEGTELRIGFITPISQHFCATCNRVRLSVEGTLYLCLGQDNSLELRPLLRQGISDEQLQKVIIEAIKLKPERHEFREKPQQVLRFMSMTGG